MFQGMVQESNEKLGIFIERLVFKNLNRPNVLVQFIGLHFFQIYDGRKLVILETIELKKIFLMGHSNK